MQIEDSRQVAKVDYSVHDRLMSAFAMMFFQDFSMLTFYRRLEDSIQINNLRTLFQVSSISKDSQLRDVLDGLSNGTIDCILMTFWVHYNEASIWHSIKSSMVTIWSLLMAPNIFHQKKSIAPIV